MMLTLAVASGFHVSFGPHLHFGLAAAFAADAMDSLDLTDQQVKAITIGRVGLQDFPLQESAVGNIDFDEDRETQIYPPYQGRLLQVLANTGDRVEKGQVLFTVDSPDLVQAESTLVSTAGVLRLTTSVLERARDLYRTKGLAQKDLDQAISDQQTADGALRTARRALLIFGKTDAEIDSIVASRRIDSALVVKSPIDGVVVARNAAPGVFVQPGTAPAPFTVADSSIMWMLANVPEGLSPEFKVGQPVSVQLAAFPGRVFPGQLSTLGATVDPVTRRIVLRSEIPDPEHLLRSGMFANFTITTGAPVRTVAAPLNGIVREGDGTMTAWVTVDRRHFTKRTVKIGLEWNGYRQILDGLHEGELVVIDGAVFLSNMLTADPT